MVKNNHRGNKPRRKPYKKHIKSMNRNRMIEKLCSKYSIKRKAAEEVFEEMKLGTMGGKYKNTTNIIPVGKYKLWVSPCNKESKLWVK